MHLTEAIYLELYCSLWNGLNWVIASLSGGGLKVMICSYINNIVERFSGLGGEY